MFADYHVHTAFSDDSDFLMEEVVKQGIHLGIEELCFTDHVDYGVKTEGNCSYEEYWREFQRIQQQYGEQIRLRCGIEFGVQAHTIGQYEQDQRNYPFDFVICSCHQVEDKEFWNQDFQRGKSQKEYNELYYEEILETVRRYDGYSVLGHLDMIKRYDDAGEYPFERVRPLIEEILKEVIAAERGIEVNTSCFRYGLPDLTPCTDILMLYRQLGGSILTVGSDSHAQPHLGYQILEVQQMLRQLGFEYVCTYNNMKPEYHRL